MAVLCSQPLSGKKKTKQPIYSEALALESANNVGCRKEDNCIKGSGKPSPAETGPVSESHRSPSPAPRAIWTKKGSVKSGRGHETTRWSHKVFRCCFVCLLFIKCRNGCGGVVVIQSTFMPICFSYTKAEGCQEINC